MKTLRFGVLSLIALSAFGIARAEAPATSPENSVAAAPAEPAAATAPAAAPVAAAATDGTAAPAPGAPAAGTEEKPVRKLTSAEPDPSLVLEPIPEEQKTKKITTKAPPRRPTAIGGPGGQGGKISSSLGGPRRLSNRLGQLPTDIPSGPEVAIILVNKQFFPSRIRLKEGVPTRLFLTTTNDETAAIVVEQLQVQRWVASDGERKKHVNEIDRARFEVRREVASQRVTEIVIDPIRGTYSFHDVISGAKGQIIVE